MKHMLMHINLNVKKCDYCILLLFVFLKLGLYAMAAQFYANAIALCSIGTYTQYTSLNQFPKL